MNGSESMNLQLARFGDGVRSEKFADIVSLVALKKLFRSCETAELEYRSKFRLRLERESRKMGRQILYTKAANVS